MESVSSQLLSPGWARTKNEAPVITVVIPTRPGAGQPRALSALQRLSFPPEKLEVIVARGTSPSRERNDAVREGHGELLLFLDDDSCVTPQLAATYLDEFARDPAIGAVGGPATALAASRFQSAAQLVLSDPWILGRSAARYGARGRRRLTDERELILCNLCVRRTAFEDAGGFCETLYPNEENEFLQRLRSRGWRLVYQPAAEVKRPQKRSVRELLCAVFRYGAGRTAQMRVRPSRLSAIRLALALGALFATAASLAGLLTGNTVFLLPFCAYGSYVLLLTLRLSLRSGPWQGVCAAALACLVHASYAAGIVKSLLFAAAAQDSREVSLERRKLGAQEVLGGTYELQHLR